MHCTRCMGVRCKAGSALRGSALHSWECAAQKLMRGHVTWIRVHYWLHPWTRFIMAANTLQWKFWSKSRQVPNCLLFHAEENEYRINQIAWHCRHSASLWFLSQREIALSVSCLLMRRNTPAHVYQLMIKSEHIGRSILLCPSLLYANSWKRMNKEQVDSKLRDA